MLSSYLYGLPPKYLGNYLIVKNSLLSLKKSLVSEYSAFNLQFNSILPSLIETSFLKNLNEKTSELSAYNNPLKRNLEIRELVPTINYLFDDENSFINGEDILVSAGENIK